jgi:hypothetical protein
MARMVRRNSKPPTDVREVVAQGAKRDPRRDSAQLSGVTALMAQMRLEITSLKKRITELERETAREQAKRLEAEEALELTKRALQSHPRDPESPSRATKQLRRPSQAERRK